MRRLRFLVRRSRANIPLSLHRKETHYKPKKQTPVYNPFNLEQSRPWLVGEGEGMEHIQSIAGRRSIVLLVLVPASKFLIPFWPY